MKFDSWSAVDDYFTELLHPNDPVLNSALEASTAAGLPDIQVSETQGKFLYLLAMTSRSKRILELGTLAGYSTIWLARALPENGSLITLESDPVHANVAQANLQRAGLSEQTDIRLGAALDSLYEMKREKTEPFDFVFLDADKENYPNYLPRIIELSKPGTLLIADNVVRNGDVTDADSTDSKVIGVRQFNELVRSEPRLDATAIQTVGSKGYDGFIIARVTK